MWKELLVWHLYTLAQYEDVAKLKFKVTQPYSLLTACFNRKAEIHKWRHIDSGTQTPISIMKPEWQQLCPVQDHTWSWHLHLLFISMVFITSYFTQLICSICLLFRICFFIFHVFPFQCLYCRQQQYPRVWFKFNVKS